MAACRAVRRIPAGCRPVPVPTASKSAALDGNQMGGTGGTPEQVYESAYDQYMNRQFGEAEAGFRLFLSRHRDHELAGNAQYWLRRRRIRPRQVQGGGAKLPHRLPDLSEEPAARQIVASQARHVARQARPEGSLFAMLLPNRMIEWSSTLPSPSRHLARRCTNFANTAVW